MILGIYTLLHVLISLGGIFLGLFISFGLLTARRFEGWTKSFLITSMLTSMTGFFFPFHGITPVVVVGVISLVLLALAFFARYKRDLVGGWRNTYVVNAVLALYLNVFVLIVQSFLKIPALRRIAPTQCDTPFKLTQLVVLVVFMLLAVVAAIRFRAERTLSILEGKE